MNTNEWLRQHNKIVKPWPDEDWSYQEIRPRVQCRNGFSISIQAGKTLYSSPREDGLSYYEEVELGFPSSFGKVPFDIREELINYSDEFDWDSGKRLLSTETVYAYVPVELVDRLLESQGGIWTYQDVVRSGIAKLMEE